MSVQKLVRAGGVAVPALILLACGWGGAGGRAKVAAAPIVVEGDPLVRGAEEGEIAALNQPDMVPASQAGSFMRDDEPVVGIAPEGEPPRAYSTWHLDDHEVVNDRLRSGPLLVTW